MHLDPRKSISEVARELEPLPTSGRVVFALGCVWRMRTYTEGVLLKRGGELGVTVLEAMLTALQRTEDGHSPLFGEEESDRLAREIAWPTAQPFAYGVFHCLSALRYACDIFGASDPYSGALMASVIARRAMDDYLEHVGSTTPRISDGSDSPIDPRWWHHPLMQQEVGKQLTDLRALRRYHEDPHAAWAHVIGTGFQGVQLAKRGLKPGPIS